jgi:hypothetical protein
LGAKQQRLDLVEVLPDQQAPHTLALLRPIGPEPAPGSSRVRSVSKTTGRRRITYRFTGAGRIVLLTTFRKQRRNERAEIARARPVAEECTRRCGASRPGSAQPTE